MSLKYSVVLWNDYPHYYIPTCCCLSINKLMVGTNVGFCILYYLNKNEFQKKMKPFQILIGHETKVVDITLCKYHSVESFCSVSSDGTICIWNNFDGRNMLYLANILTGIPSKIINLKEKSLIVSCGKHNNIEIIDLNKSRVIITLEGHKNFIQNISCGIFTLPLMFHNHEEEKKYEKSGLLLSLSKKNEIGCWVLIEKEKKMKKKNKKQIQIFYSKFFKNNDENNDVPLIIKNNENWTYILTMYKHRWNLYAFSINNPIFEKKIEDEIDNDGDDKKEKEEFQNGFFLSENIIIICYSNGKSKIYILEDLKERIDFNITNFIREKDDSTSIEELVDGKKLLDENNNNKKDPQNATEEEMIDLAKKAAFEKQMIYNMKKKKKRMKLSLSFDRFSQLFDNFFKGYGKKPVNFNNNSAGKASQIIQNINKKKFKNLSIDTKSEVLHSQQQKKNIDDEDTYYEPVPTPTPSTPSFFPSFSKSQIEKYDKMKKNFSYVSISDLKNDKQNNGYTKEQIENYYKFKRNKSFNENSDLEKNFPQVPSVVNIDEPTFESPTKVPNKKEDIITEKKEIKDEDEKKSEENEEVKEGKEEEEEKEKKKNEEKEGEEEEEEKEKTIEPPELLKTLDFKIKKKKNGKIYWCFNNDYLCIINNNNKNESKIMKLEIVSDKHIESEEIKVDPIGLKWPEETKKTKSSTCSFLYVDEENIPLLLNGYGDGKIGFFPMYGEHFFIESHSEAVTAIFVKKKDNDIRILISGSENGEIKIWKFKGFKLLHTFYHHTEMILSIFLPPKYFQKKLGECFCSIGDDRRIGLYSIEDGELIHSFGGHSTPIKNVHWRFDLDYLLVKCLDGTVYIWQVSTGLLERRVFGLIAKGLIEQSEGHGYYKKPVLNTCFKFQDVEKLKGGFFKAIPMRINENKSSPNLMNLMLRVRNVINYIQKKKEKLQSIQKVSLDEYKKLYFSNSFKSAIGYIFRFGSCCTLDLLRDLLNIPTPSMYYHVGLRGMGSTYSIILPKKNTHTFRFSSVLSALQILSCLAVLNSLSFIPEIKQLCIETKKYYLDGICGDYHEGFEYPSFLWCSQFLKDNCKDIQLASRSLMGGVLNKMGLLEVKKLATKLSTILIENRNQMSENKRQNVLVSLAVLSYRVPKAVNEKIASVTAKGLIEIMDNGGSQYLTAISLLGEGYSIWQYYVPSPHLIIKELFNLSIPSLTTNFNIIKNKSSNLTDLNLNNNNNNNSNSNLSIDALKSFLNMSCIDTNLYIKFLESLFIPSITQIGPSIDLTAGILTLSPLIERHPKILVEYLVVITSLLLKLIDPHFTNVRKSCMKPTIKILRKMVEKYPMISFHQQKQKLAVGNQDGIIVIYDLQTASKWQLFEAHDGPCRVLTFSKKGKYLASFSPNDSKCKVWNVDGSGVLNLLGVASRSIREFEVPSAKKDMNMNEILKYLSITWDDNDNNSKKKKNKRGFALRPCKLQQRVHFSL